MLLHSLNMKRLGIGLILVLLVVALFWRSLAKQKELNSSLNSSVKSSVAPDLSLDDSENPLKTEEASSSLTSSAQSSAEASVGKVEESLFEGEVELDENRLAFQQVVKNPKKKYPLTLNQQVWRVSRTDPTKKEYLGERKMVADHLLVKLHSTNQSAEFESHITSFGMKIRKKMSGSGIFIVEFEMNSHDALQKAQKRLLGLPEVRSVSPDFISKAVF